MTKREYLKACAAQPSEWLLGCLAEPSMHMRPIHLALIRIALRNRRASS